MAKINAYISDEKKEILIRLYNEGISLNDMQKDVGYCRKKLTAVVRRLIAEGELQERTRHRTKYVQKVDARMKAKAEEIVALYNDNVKQRDIAEQIGMSYGYVNKLIVRLKRDGVIGERRRVTTPRTKKPQYKPIRQFAESTLAPGETIKCTFKVSCTCVYGIENGDMAENGLCRYSRVTGKCRSVGTDGCSCNACTKYSKVSKTNPRLSVKGDFEL